MAERALLLNGDIVSDEFDIGEAAVFYDRDHIEQLPAHVADYILRNELHTASSSRVNFVGSIYLDGNFSIFFPRNSSVPSEHIEDKFLLLSKFFEVIKNTHGKRLHLQSKGDCSPSFNLGIIEQLVRDYRKNGLLKVHTKTERPNNQRVDWSATIARALPFITERKVPVYVEPIFKKASSLQEGLVTMIHGNVLNLIARNYFGDQFTSILNTLELKRIEALQNKINSKDALIELQKLRATLFDDRSIFVVNLLINFLQNIDFAAGFKLFGTKGFEYCWEYVLKSLAENKIEVTHLMPRPLYVSETNTFRVSRLRTDYVCRKDGKTIVYDAKYYEGGLSQYPGWSDIVKQLFYGDIIKKRFPHDMVRSIFVMPGNGAANNHAQRLTFEEDPELNYPDIQIKYQEPMDLLADFTSK